MRIENQLEKPSLHKQFVDFGKKQTHVGNQTILVADDAADTRLIVSRSLEFDGFNCITAGDGREVLDLIQQHKPRLIVLDLMLPELNGFQVLLRLQNYYLSSERPKICVISSIDKPDFVKRAFEFGADDYLVKPILPDMLSYRVRKVLNQSSTDDYFFTNCNFLATLNHGETKNPCHITKISEVGLTIKSRVNLSSSNGVCSITCPSLTKIIETSNPIFIKRSASSGSLRETRYDFVALPESRMEKLRSVVIRGKYISDANFKN